MSDLRFFARDLDGSDGCIPLLDVGADRDLQEPNPIIRLAGRDEAGGRLFDHVALGLAGRDVKLIAGAVDRALAETENSVTSQELRHLRNRLARMEVLVAVRERIGRIVCQLGTGETLELHDGTRIECMGEHPAAYRVLVRDTPGDPSVVADGMGEGVDWRTAVDVALDDVPGPGRGDRYHGELS